MTTYLFLVEVDVEGWDDDPSPFGYLGNPRSPAGYAEAALHKAVVPDASSLDGYADLNSKAEIRGVYFEPGSLGT